MKIKVLYELIIMNKFNPQSDDYNHAFVMQDDESQQDYSDEETQEYDE